MSVAFRLPEGKHFRYSKPSDISRYSFLNNYLKDVQKGEGALVLVNPIERSIFMIIMPAEDQKMRLYARGDFLFIKNFSSHITCKHWVEKEMFKRVTGTEQLHMRFLWSDTIKDYPQVTEFISKENIEVVYG